MKCVLEVDLATYEQCLHRCIPDSQPHNDLGFKSRGGGSERGGGGCWIQPWAVLLTWSICAALAVSSLPRPCSSGICWSSSSQVGKESASDASSPSGPLPQETGPATRGGNKMNRGTMMCGSPIQIALLAVGQHPTQTSQSLKHQGVIQPSQSLKHQGVIQPSQSLKHQGVIQPSQSLKHQGVIQPSQPIKQQGVIQPSQPLKQQGVIKATRVYPTLTVIKAPRGYATLTAIKARRDPHSH